MNPFTLSIGYSDDRSMREKLYPLFEQVFHIPATELADYYARGFWNPTYQPYTLFDGSQAAANVSMFELELVIKDTLVKAAGIQSVMTHPAYRRQGLMRQLFKRMLEDIDEEYETAWLFTEQPELYEPFGFRVVPQHAFRTAWKHQSEQIRPSLRIVDFDNEQDVQLIRTCFAGHQPISREFSPVSYESSFFLHMYSPSFQKKVHYAQSLQAVVVFEVKEEELHLYDVIGASIPDFGELCAAITEPFSSVTVHACADRFGSQSWTPYLHTAGGYLMVRGTFDESKTPVRMPMTSAF